MGDREISVEAGSVGAGSIDISGLSPRHLDELSQSSLSLELRRVLEAQPDIPEVTADWLNCL
jgi:hypothetical protein